MSEATREEICAVAIAELFRGDGEIMASPMGSMPKRGAILAKRTFEPDLVLSDGVATLIDLDGVPEAPMTYRDVFHTLWSGRRHVVMGASQIDRYGNQNISMLGSDFARPKVQLLGVRGAPGNTLNHVTSYWVPQHSPRVLVEQVDVVSGVGYDRVAALGEMASRFHEIRAVVTNLAVLDFRTPDHRMRIRSVHPGVAVAEVQAATGFELVVSGEVAETRLPSAGELALLRSGTCG